FPNEFPMGFDGVGADSQHYGAMLFERGELVPKSARFFGAARRIVPGIEVEDDIAPLEIGQRHCAALFGGGSKFRRFVPWLQFEFELFWHSGSWSDGVSGFRD